VSNIRNLFRFKSPDDLAKQIAYAAILDLLVADKANLHLAALVDSLIDMAAMIFVDLMRLTCVGGSDLARAANAPRYPEFVDVAHLHFNEFRTHVSRVTAHLGSEIVRKSSALEGHLGYLLVHQRRAPSLDRSWREMLELLADVAVQLGQLAEYVRRDYYAQRFRDIAALVVPAIASSTSKQGLRSPDEFVLARFSIQSLVLRHLRERGIHYDIDRRLAIPYFVVDAILLRDNAVHGRSLESLGHARSRQKSEALATNAPAAIAATTPDAIPYDEAVKGKEIVANISGKQWALGDLAADVGDAYGVIRLEQFAKDINFHGAPCTLGRYRDVCRAWPKNRPRARFFSSAKILATHPGRWEIVERNPEISKREASELMRKWHAEHPGTPDQADEDEVEEE
jgi:hypothetical protein